MLLLLEIDGGREAGVRPNVKWPSQPADCDKKYDVEIRVDQSPPLRGRQYRDKASKILGNSDAEKNGHGLLRRTELRRKG
jgi:hypothetical protein